MKVFGPIKSSKDNHAFSSVKYYREKLDLEKYDFIEEEYFISGKACLYDYSEKDDRVFIVDESLPYTTRILLRRPRDIKAYSGRTYLDILNATNGYDIEDLWRRSYLYILENKHMYVGITSKPINVLSLKNFNYPRYKSLNWSNGKLVAMPATIDPISHSIEGTEEGLIWDILLGLGQEIKRKEGNFLGQESKYLYLSGQSQSGVYLNTFINYMHNYYLKKGIKVPFDGYLSLASGGLNRSLRQKEGQIRPMSMIRGREARIDRPVISFNSENDHSLFRAIDGGLVRGTNEDSPTNKRRYYEMTAAPHTNSASKLIPTNDEIVKTKCPPRLLDKDYTYILNDIPFDYYVNAFLEKLHEWVVTGEAPPIIDPIDFGKKDKFGHYYGGLRSPFIEFPIASYRAVYEPGSVNGTMEFFDKKKIINLYGSLENYLNKFSEYAKNQQTAGLLLEKDKERALTWAKERINKILGRD